MANKLVFCQQNRRGEKLEINTEEAEQWKDLQ